MAIHKGDMDPAEKRLANFRVCYCRLVRFVNDRRTYQGGAKRNKRLQEYPKIELVLR